MWRCIFRAAACVCLPLLSHAAHRILHFGFFFVKIIARNLTKIANLLAQGDGRVSKSLFGITCHRTDLTAQIVFRL